MSKKATTPETPAPAVGRSARKHLAILGAATDVFLSSGYLAASMDEIAAAAHVSKQTIYKHFASKEALFIQVVARLTDRASDTVHNDAPEPHGAGDVRGYLEDYAFRQLRVVLTPTLMQLRRMVIGEAGRFPELGKALYDGGPGRAIQSFAASLGRLAACGFVDIEDANVAAAQFNWLVMGGPLNEAMLLGDGAIPDAPSLRRHAADAVRVFLAAYGK